MIPLEAKQSRALRKLKEILTRLNNVIVYDYGNEVDEGKVFVFFNYGEGIATIEQKAKFVDKLARLLSSDGSYDAYSVILELVWMGDKGIGGSNEPFAIMKILIEGIEAVADILKEHEVEFVGNTSSNTAGRLP